MPVAAFKGWMGFACLFLMGISNFIVKNWATNYVASLHLSELGATLYLAAILSLPLAGLSVKKWRETKIQTQTVFFIPLHFFVIVLAILGYIFRDFVPPEVAPTDL